ncbi:NifU family protein [Pseudonocardia xinjiangensis]|uniref:NifU family protein n=1 Tax=Pseudonocardia xinjiangensis TaxID=75289 RepID=A0ABX1RET7_9PSEU|nr:NifU family protein [Pseudonocardia xinjiangensis]NMH78306.1 NifU family protein [Pseudonocardia xinjiangensis]
MASTDLDPQGLAGRIEELLEGITTDGGPAVGHAAEELVRVLMKFYGAGLEQMVSIAAAGAGDTIVHRMAADPLVAGLLALHDLHPVPVEQRLGHALDTSRRKLGSHGTGLRLAGIDDEGRVHVQIAGGGCGTDTIKDVVAASISELAPEVAGVVFDAAPAGPALLQIGVRPPSQEKVG